jgi:hypothetical protein
LYEALEVTRTIECIDRAETLMDLIPYLPEPLKVEAFNEAVEASVDEQTGNMFTWLAARLGEVAPFLPESLQRSIIKWYPVETLVSLSPHLPEPLLREALEIYRLREDTSERALALAALGPHLPDPLKTEVVGEALVAFRTRLWVDRREARALSILVPYLSEPLKTEVLHETLERVQRDMVRSGAKRAIVLGELAPCLPEPRKTEVLRDALEAIWTSINRYPDEVEDYYCMQGLTILAPHLTTILPTDLYKLWQETLHSLANRSRTDLLAGLRSLLPVMITLGGIETLTETAHAILEVRRWWP